MWFASHLFAKKLITGDQFAQAVRLQLERRPRIGALVISRGLLTIKQVMAVLSAQADNLERPFGELAVELGYLTREQLAELLFEQDRQAPPLGTILLELGALSVDDFRRELRTARTESLSCESNTSAA